MNLGEKVYFLFSTILYQCSILSSYTILFSKTQNNSTYLALFFFFFLVFEGKE